jgi:hypothetical protein
MLQIFKNLTKTKKYLKTSITFCFTEFLKFKKFIMLGGRKSLVESVFLDFGAQPQSIIGQEAMKSIHEDPQRGSFPYT